VIVGNRFAVFGHPISHSLSPEIHQAFAAQEALTLCYEAMDAAPDQFEAALQQFFAAGGRGANITLPHKAAAFLLADHHSAAARRVGTANVLTRRLDGRLAAHNTDGSGMIRDMVERHRIDLHGRHALLVGAGGAARGIAWHLLDAGIADLSIVNRTPAAAYALADALGAPARAYDWAALPTLGSFDLIVNATSAGVLGQILDLPFSLVGQQALCYDLSYGQAAHSFLAWATTARAHYALDGLGMLIETAADTFALCHGRRPATDPVYAALRPRYA
jgi:shikimate dehydrogenase